MMWENIFKHRQILAATFFSVVIVVGAYFLARGIQSPSVTQASEESALLHAIATRDSDADGLPDWEESLYGTDPHIADTFKLGMTDGEAVTRGLIVPKAIADIRVATSSAAFLGTNDLPSPAADGSLTATFAQNFFTLFIAAKQTAGGADLSESEMNDVATQALNSLISSVKIASDFKAERDLSISNSTPDAFKAFAKSAETVLMNNTADATTTALKYLKSALEHNDTTAFPHILSIAKAYRDTAAGFAALPVPKELVADDLLLINAMMRLGGIIADFARANEDPLVAILALKQYPTVVQSMGAAFVNIGKAYATNGIVLPVGTPGASFVNLADDTAKEDTASVQKP
ncbi:MAG: hypothetical protein NTV60_00100 [Candidatus Kaiserbacteria bacterium]|nr:hypothetical protein [Candidatus Kaiserbacteria bacterium]